MKPIHFAAILAACAALCSCAQLKDVPVKGCVNTKYGTVCYDSKAGVSVNVDADSGK